jgi:hypothetical protein
VAFFFVDVALHFKKKKKKNEQLFATVQPVAGWLRLLHKLAEKVTHWLGIQT